MRARFSASSRCCTDSRLSSNCDRKNATLTDTYGVGLAGVLLFLDLGAACF